MLITNDNDDNTIKNAMFSTAIITNIRTNKNTPLNNLFYGIDLYRSMLICHQKGREISYCERRKIFKCT